MYITDFFSTDDLEKLQQELHEQYHLNADIMDAEGKRLFGNTWGNDLCKAIREDAKGKGGICVPAGQVFIHLMQEGEPYVEECDAGLIRLQVPVVVDGTVVGGIGGCGLLLEDGEADGFTIGMMSDIDESAATEMAEKLEPVTDEKVQEILAFIQKRIEEIRK